MRVVDHDLDESDLSSGSIGSLSGSERVVGPEQTSIFLVSSLFASTTSLTLSSHLLTPSNCLQGLFNYSHAQVSDSPRSLDIKHWRLSLPHLPLSLPLLPSFPLLLSLLRYTTHEHGQT